MLDLPARLTLIVELLCRAVARFVALQARGPATVLLGTRVYVEITRPSPHKPIPQEIWHLFIVRSQRIAARFAALVRHWHAGTLPQPRKPRPPADATAPRRDRLPYRRLPRARGWVNRRIAAAAQPAGLLEAMLHWPDLPRLVEAAPQAGRLIRPLAHALGVILPPCLRLPPRPPRPDRAKRPAPRPAIPRDRPLQPYVRAATRAWKPKST